MSCFMSMNISEQRYIYMAETSVTANSQKVLCNHCKKQCLQSLELLRL